MILEVEQIKAGTTAIMLKISYFNEKGEVDFLKVVVDEPKKWEITSYEDSSKSNDFVNWDGRPVRKVDCTFLSKFEIHEVLANLDAADKALVTGLNIPSLSSIDIETEIADEFPNAKETKQPINAISISRITDNILNIESIGVRDLTQQDEINCLSFIRQHIKKPEKYNHITVNWSYKCFSDEVEMLRYFVNDMLSKCSAITGWNFEDFDWQYITNRIIKLNKDLPKSKQVILSDASPSKKMNKKPRTDTEFDTIDIYPSHIYGFDYLNFYKKYDRKIKIRESNKLDYVAEQATGLNKLKYDKGLQELYLNDFPKFICYNAIDAALVCLIHEELKTINSQLMIANQNFLSVYRSMSPVAMMESMLFHQFYAEGKVVADTFTKRPKEDYEGAYIKEPVAGIYSDVICFDFASLYPSIMRIFFMSPDTYVKELNLKSKVDAVTKEIDFYKQSKDFVVSPSGAVFKREKGALTKVLDRLYLQRRTYKKRALEIEKHLDKYNIK